MTPGPLGTRRSSGLTYEIYLGKILVQASQGLYHHQYHQLGAEDAQEHCERIYGCITYGRLVTVLVLFAGKGKRWRVGTGTCKHSDKGIVSQFHEESAD